MQPLFQICAAFSGNPPVSLALPSKAALKHKITPLLKVSLWVAICKPLLAEVAGKKEGEVEVVGCEAKKAGSREIAIRSRQVAN